MYPFIHFIFIKMANAAPTSSASSSARTTPLSAPSCSTCGSEIVETVNDSVFNDGECGGCEYQRYRSQWVLLEYCEMLLEDVERMAVDPEIGREWDWSLTERNLKALIAAVRHG